MDIHYLALNKVRNTPSTFLEMTEILFKADFKEKPGETEKKDKLAINWPLEMTADDG